MNYTIPGRFHLIALGADVLLYVTLWFRGHRYHYAKLLSPAPSEARS